MSFITSITIPSQDNMFDMNINLYKRTNHINPVKSDNSTWFSVIYESWDITDINIDLLNRIKKLDDKNIKEMRTCVSNIKEGICILKKKIVDMYQNEIVADNMCKNLEMSLSISRLSQISKCYFEAVKVINDSKTTKQYFKKIIHIFRKTFKDFNDYDNIVETTCKNLKSLFYNRNI